jgi:hypothetical protein
MQSKNNLNLFDEIWKFFRETFLPKDSDVAISPIQPEQEDQTQTLIADKGVDSNTQTVEEVALSIASDTSADITSSLDLYDPNTQVPDDTEPVIPTPIDEKGDACLSDIRKFASWDGPDGAKGLKAAKNLFVSQYPGNTIEVEQAIAKGLFEKDLYKKAYQLGFGKQSEEKLQELVDSVGASANDINYSRMKNQYFAGRNSRKRTDEQKKLKKKGAALSNVQPRSASPVKTVLPKAPLSTRPCASQSIPGNLHANDLRCLKPANHWQLIIDETGTTFDETAIEASQKNLGRFVGIIVPAGRTVLPNLPLFWHAVDKSIDEIDRVVQSVLDAPVGVLGIDVRFVPVTPGERWMDGVALLIDWVLRLLPVEGKTRIEVMIEQRGLFQAGQSWEIVRRDCLRRHAFAYPQRALQIDLDISVIEKKGTPLNGYADAIAFTWAKTTDSSKERLKRAALDGTCLLSSGAGIDARAILNAWDAFAQGVHLPPSIWWDMLGTMDALNPASLISAFLNLVGKELQTKPIFWGALLAEVKLRMSSAPVDLRRLATGIDWLQHCKPKDCMMLPAMRLIWLTVQLALANHMGKIEEKWQSELERIEKQIFDESAPLVCYAHLHRAVAATNRYDFGMAGRILEDWTKLPPSVPGLQHWAQVQSSLGQHAAFLGENDRAIELFRNALNAFSRLSDPEARLSNQRQTGCYLAIALMDQPNSNDDDVRRAVEQITGPLPDIVANIAMSANPDDRFAHHLLLRWLAYRGNDETLMEYLKIRNSWHVGDGHPWPLIQIYRGILMYHSHPEEAKEFVLDAAKRAFADDQGPVVRLIGSCCRVVAIGMGEPWTNGEVELNKLAEILPLASARIERLKSTIQNPIAPLSLISEVLPFNFR